MKMNTSGAVGSINLILESIFQNLSGTELLTVRLVNKTWLNIATNVMKKRNCLTVELPQLSNYDNLVPAILSPTFPAVVQKWKYPPCNHELDRSYVHNTCNSISRIAGQKARGLILDLGSFLHNQYSLSLSLASCPLQPAFGILFDANEISELGLIGTKDGTGIPHSANHIPQNIAVLWRSNLQLNYLKKLELTPVISELSSFLSIVLHAAPNLTLITGFHLSMTSFIGRAGKIHCVESLVVNDVEPNLLSELAQFCSFNPALKHLEIVVKEGEDLEVDEVKDRAIGQVLLANKNSLRRIKTSRISYIDSINTTATAPVFQNLRVLELCNPRDIKRSKKDDAKRIKRILPSGLSPRTCFPRLNEVILQLKGLKLAYLEEYFPDDDYVGLKVELFPSVQKLEIKCGYDRGGMDIIAAKFPNVKHVKFFQILSNYTYSLTTDIWRLPQTIQSLTLHFYATDHAHQVKQLDPLLTGISQNKLHKLKGDEFMNIKFSSVATRKNIHSYTNLKSLKIIFDGNEDQLLRNRMQKKEKKEDIFLNENTLTLASGLYAFQRYQETKVSIAFDHRAHYAERLREILLPIEPYVTFDPFYKSDSIAPQVPRNDVD